MIPLAAATFLAFAAPAVAQDYGYDTSYENSAGEDVVVTAPRYSPERSPIGAPYRYVSMSKGVYVGDLDLRSGYGIHVMRDRIRKTARRMCRQLDMRYPISAPDSPDCYRNAMNNAMYRANVAIAQLRGYDDDRY
jgi:UrcA family protein